MTRKINRLFSFVLTLAVLISTIWGSELPVFAAESDVIPNGYTSYDVVKQYVEQANSQETVQIGSEWATYYYGDNFVVVNDKNGYALITVNEHTGEIRLNNTHIDVVETYGNNIMPFAAEAYWSLFSDKTYNFSVGGLTATVAAGIISAACPTIGVGILVGVLSDYFLQGIIPTGATASVHEVKYFHIIDTMLGTMEWKIDDTLYANGNYVWSKTFYQ